MVLTVRVGDTAHFQRCTPSPAHSHITPEWLRLCALESDSLGSNPVSISYSYVASAELANLSVLQFPHLQNREFQYYLPRGAVLGLG